MSLAFFLGTVLANMLGTNFQDLGPRIGSIVMALVALAVLVYRRIPTRRSKR